MSKEIEMRELDFLLRFNIDHHYVSPIEFLSNQAWSAIKVNAHEHDPHLFFFFFFWFTSTTHLLVPCLCPGDELHG